MNIGLANSIISNKTCSVNSLVVYWSNCESNFPMEKYCPLHYKALQANKFSVLQINNRIYNGKAIISPQVINELNWWVLSIQLAHYYLTTHDQTGTLRINRQFWVGG